LFSEYFFLEEFSLNKFPGVGFFPSFTFYDFALALQIALGIEHLTISFFFLVKKMMLMYVVKEKELKKN
jgi:hypothetical protein